MFVHSLRFNSPPLAARFLVLHNQRRSGWHRPCLRHFWQSIRKNLHERAYWNLIIQHGDVAGLHPNAAIAGAHAVGSTQNRVQCEFPCSLRSQQGFACDGNVIVNRLPLLTGARFKNCKRTSSGKSLRKSSRYPRILQRKKSRYCSFLWTKKLSAAQRTSSSRFSASSRTFAKNSRASGGQLLRNVSRLRTIDGAPERDGDDRAFCSRAASDCPITRGTNALRPWPTYWRSSTPSTSTLVNCSLRNSISLLNSGGSSSATKSSLHHRRVSSPRPCSKSDQSVLLQHPLGRLFPDAQLIANQQARENQPDQRASDAFSLLSNKPVSVRRSRAFVLQLPA